MIDDIRVFSRQLAYSLIGLAVLLAGTQVFITAMTGKHPPHYNPSVEMVVFLLGFLVAPLTLFLATRYSSWKLPAVIVYHFFIAIQLVWYSEAFSPFTTIWSMMILLASIYYAWRGFILSSLLFCAQAALYCVLFMNELPLPIVIYGPLVVLVLALTIFTSFLFVRIIMNSHNKNVELVKARRSEQMQINRQTTLLNSISDAVMTLNRYGRITSQNAAAQAFFDTNKSLIGRDIDMLLPLKDMVNTPVSVHSLITDTKTSNLREDLSIGEGGDVRHLSLQMSRIRSTFDDNEEYGVVLIMRDITKQKTLEEEKDEFISVTSHELRTPVAIAEGSLSNLLVMEDRQVEPEKLRDAATMAHDQVLYLAKMVNDLSTLSRAERGVGDTVEPIDINDLLHDLYNRYLADVQQKSLTLDLDADAHLPRVETSRLYLEEILQNFLTNAIKYTKQGAITFGAHLGPDETVSFFVTDTGIGMSKADLDHIFEKFYRSEDYRTRETSGTGLGLYVVSKLAAKLDTHIDVTSRLNHGSTFSFTLSLRSSKLGTKLHPDDALVSVPASPTA